MRTLVGISLAALLISGCGGGSGGPRPVSNPDVRTLTGSQAPLETPTDQRARTPAILARGDSLIYSTMHGETSSPDVPTFYAQSSCSGSRCSFYESQTGIQFTFGLEDLVDDPATTSTAVLSKHGITTIQERGASSNAYGSWMQHSAFGVGSASDRFDGVSITVRTGASGGDLTGYRPSGSMTWRGLMVGTPATGAGRGNILQGDAMLTYRTSGTLDASFTSIKNIDTLRNHTVGSVRFTSVPVASNGTFLAGVTGNKIQGGFYGSGHAETAGIFEQSGIVGAFGAKR